MIGKRIDISELEIALVVTKMSWALMFLLPVAVFERSPAYAPMASVTSERNFGLLGLAINIIVLIGALTHRRWVQLLGLSLATVWWSFIAGTFYVTHSVPTGIAAYGVLAGSALWRVFARISGYSDALYIYRNGTLPGDVRRRREHGQANDDDGDYHRSEVS